jgi:hypothetical protein
MDTTLVPWWGEHLQNPATRRLSMRNGPSGCGPLRRARAKFLRSGATPRLMTRVRSRRASRRSPAIPASLAISAIPAIPALPVSRHEWQVCRYQI